MEISAPVCSAQNFQIRSVDHSTRPLESALIVLQ